MKLFVLGSALALLTFTSATRAGQPVDISAAPVQAADATAASMQIPVPPPTPSPKIKRLLRAMGEASTEWHPDLFGQFAGMRRLYDGDYDGAMKYFKIGAYNADKLSQLSVAMLYLHGRGVTRSNVAACAWMTLAAERGFPTYVNARDAICATLSAAQRAESTTLLNSLLPEYGDAVARKRMELQLRSARNALTGSHLGHDANVHVMGPESANCSGDRLSLGGVVVPRRGCGRYQEDLLDAKKYFAARDAQWTGTVTIGELKPQTADPAPSAGGKKGADGGR